MHRDQLLLHSHDDRPEEHDKAGQVYARIRAVLMSYRVAPSTFLNIRSLSRALNVSPTPVREALIRLVNEEVIVQAPAGRGYFSRTPSVDELAAEYEAALVIITYALEKNGGDFSLVGIRRPLRLVADFKVEKEEPGEACSIIAFIEMLYQRLAELSGNRVLERYMQQFIDRTSFIREFDILRPHRLQQIVSDMAMFIELLDNKKIEEALSNLREQSRIKFTLLPELVQGVTQRGISENKSIESLLSENR